MLGGIADAETQHDFIDEQGLVARGAARLPQLPVELSPRLNAFAFEYSQPPKGVV